MSVADTMKTWSISETLISIIALLLVRSPLRQRCDV